jgi:hypothetical protein
MSSSEKDTNPEAPEAHEDHGADHGADDDVRAKFKAALDKKHGPGGVNGNPHAQGGSMAPHTNDKVTRQFRRKSGG